MTSEPLHRLRDFIKLVRGTTYKGELVGNPGPVLLGLASIKPDGGFRRGSFKTYGGECSPKITLGPGDLYVSLKDVTQSGDLLGSVARVPEDISSGRLTQDTVKLAFNSSEINKAYIYWLLRTPEYRSYCRAHATGTTTLGLARDDFLGFPVPEVGPAELDLVDLLEAIETRIAGLCETNTTLEAIAQALFKSWFVYFDPIHAKMQGLAPEGMDAATAALFPDSFEKSELGPVPKGWQVMLIGNAVETLGGATPDTKAPEYWEPAEHHWTTPKDLSGVASPFLLNTERKLSDAGLKKISSGLLPVGSLLMSSRAPIGYLALTQVPMAINQGYIAIPPGGKLSPLFMLFWCQSNMDNIKGRANGSTFMEISKKAFRPIPALVPSHAVLDAFEGVVLHLFARLVENEKQAQSLASIRDTLLPRLTSRQLRVHEIAEVAEL